MGREIGFIVLGAVAGVLSGLVGIGGGVLIVPALAFVFGLSQHQAQGTTLAMMVPPIGVLAAWSYYKQGYVDLRVAALLCLGFVGGSVYGSKLAIGVSNRVLRKVFGAAMLAIAIKLIAAD